MQPQTAPSQTPRQDGFKPKYRHFSPLARVWVQNPFDHDVVFQVADEYNRPFKYRLPAGRVSELPGGAIATLGVKRIVDELIQNSKEDEMQMWDENVRTKYETGDKGVILRIKETKPMADSAVSGEIDLSVKGSDAPDETAEAVEEPEEAFPGLNVEQPAPGQGENYTPQLDALPEEAAAGINDVVAASLPRTNSVTTPNNANATAEG